MRRETAYKLAGRKHHQSDVLSEAQCQHELRFVAAPEGHAERALELLKGLPYLVARPGSHRDSVAIAYDLAHYTLVDIERELLSGGCLLDESLVSRLKRSLTHFCEETRRRNARAPQRLIKQSNQVYVKAYEHHPHGDHDETPPELREYK